MLYRPPLCFKEVVANSSGGKRVVASYLSQRAGNERLKALLRCKKNRCVTKSRLLVNVEVNVSKYGNGIQNVNEKLGLF